MHSQACNKALMTDVILVNERGEEIGAADIIEAHMGKGLLHKAFSVYVFRQNRQELLLQKRSEKKMLWPLIWANTCCSHPRKGETSLEAGERRLQEEMGFNASLSDGPSFVYRAEDVGRGVEHEHLTLLAGDVDDANVIPDPEEVAEYKWMNVEELMGDLQKSGELYAPWLKLGLPKLV